MLHHIEVTSSRWIFGNCQIIISLKPFPSTYQSNNASRYNVMSTTNAPEQKTNSETPNDTVAESDLELKVYQAPQDNKPSSLDAPSSKTVFNCNTFSISAYSIQPVIVGFAKCINYENAIKIYRWIPICYSVIFSHGNCSNNRKLYSVNVQHQWHTNIGFSVIYLAWNQLGWLLLFEQASAYDSRSTVMQSVFNQANTGWCGKVMEEKVGYCLFFRR